MIKATNVSQIETSYHFSSMQKKITNQGWVIHSVGGKLCPIIDINIDKSHLIMIDVSDDKEWVTIVGKNVLPTTFSFKVNNITSYLFKNVTNEKDDVSSARGGVSMITHGVTTIGGKDKVLIDQLEKAKLNATAAAPTWLTDYFHNLENERKVFKQVGTYEQKSRQAIMMDSGSGTADVGITVDKVLPGKWQVFYRSYGENKVSLYTKHDNVKEDLSDMKMWTRCDGEIGMDIGMAGIYDVKAYPRDVEMLLDELDDCERLIHPFGVSQASGYGDGTVLGYIHVNEIGDVVGMRIEYDPELFDGEN
jgi:hypothetical protein